MVLGGEKWVRTVLVAWLGVVAVAGAVQWEQPSGKWERLTGCQLVPNAADDGDSFYVRQGGREFLFRIYAVDAPETTMNYPERVGEQAKHFHITSEQAVRAGLEAEKFTARLLTGATLTVDTCWQDAKGASRVHRYYAVVTVNGRDLAEQLAAAGLARVYGFTPTGLPGFSLARLEAMEQQARARKLGAYGGGRAAVSPVKSGGEVSRLPPTMSSFKPTPSPATAASSPVGGRVDLNTATAAELDALPGIGPHLVEAIQAGRPYRSVEDISRVKGIGKKTLAKLIPYLAVSGH